MTRLPMGLKGDPAFFQRSLANKVLVGRIMVICKLYLDDLIIFARTVEELVQNFCRVLDRFREFNIFINPSKCKLGLQEVTFVGHSIGANGIHFSRDKLDGITNIVKPITQGGLKTFLGMANYFRDHVKNQHSLLVRPLNRMLTQYNKADKLEWMPEQERAFDEIKSAINDCPMLFFLDDESPIHLYTDASDFGFGAHLFQLVDGVERPIRFVSQAFDERMCNWDVPQKGGICNLLCSQSVGLPLEG